MWREEVSGVVVGLCLAIWRVLRVLQMNVTDFVPTGEPRTVEVGPLHVVYRYLRRREVSVVYLERVSRCGEGEQAAIETAETEGCPDGWEPDACEEANCRG